MNLGGNTIVITGGTSGIGLGLTELFLKEGNRVIVCGRRKERLDRLAAENPGLATYVCDISDENQRTAFAAWVQKDHPETNILVNNAGVWHTRDIGSGLDFRAVQAELQTNIAAVVHLSDLFIPFLAGKPGAALLNISSGLAFVPLAHMPVYSATKAAVHSLTLSMRYLLKDQGIEVIEIIPPAVDTEFGNSLRGPGGRTFGGMPLGEFIDWVHRGLKNQAAEIPVGTAVNLREKGEVLFEVRNSPT